MNIHLRTLQAEDSENLFAWRNDPTTRKNSRRTGELSRADHDIWFAERLATPDQPDIYRVGVLDGVPVGLVWSNATDHGRELHYRVAPERRGQGVGKAMVRAFVDAYLAEQKFHCPIMQGNVASEKIAASLGLTRDPDSAHVMSETDSRILVCWV